jgi:tetratricopeptide (TPR) repeat protein
MANPREHIRAAQAAELTGDKAEAIAELRKAAALYQQAGNLDRALQLLRHARSLDPTIEELAEELRQLEQIQEAADFGQAQGFEADRGVRQLRLTAEERAERQRLIDEALQDLQDTEDEEPLQAPPPARPHPSSVALEVRALSEGEVTTLVADVDSSGSRYAGATAEAAMFDRGPIRADPSMDAWCSFCCRPGGEVGELVAGPTGSFICAGCVTESRGLLSLEDTPPERPQASRPRVEQADAVELVGQQEMRALLERALRAGARRLLVIGPEGSGKSVWFRQLEREKRGTVVTLDLLEEGGGGVVVFLEDVDRFMPDEWLRLGGFMARYPERTVLLSARGTAKAPSLRLSGAVGSLPVFTTSALSQAVFEAVPMELLEQVQVVLTLQVPEEAEFREIARQRLASRGPGLVLSEAVIEAFAAEAARSPRAGHELNALLTRALAGSWSLEGEGQKPRARKAPAKKPARRGGRKAKP